MDVFTFLSLETNGIEEYFKEAQDFLDLMYSQTGAALGIFQREMNIPMWGYDMVSRILELFPYLRKKVPALLKGGGLACSNISRGLFVALPCVCNLGIIFTWIPLYSIHLDSSKKTVFNF